MKMGASVWSFPGEWDLETIFKISKNAGFDGVEVALSETGEINLNSTEADLNKVKELAKKYGIELYSVASGLYWNYSLTSNDESVRAKAKNIVKKQLEIAHILGCDTILVLPGSVGVDFLANSEIIEYDIAFDRALEAMNELKEDAKKWNVTIGVENVWNKFLLSPLEMRDFIDQVNSQFVGSYFDVGNVLYNGYPEHWIKILGNRIRKVHFKDYKKAVGTLSGFVDILAGDVNYPKIMEAFQKIGYDGWVTAEVGFSKDYPEQSIYNTAKSIGQILNREENYAK